jgi:hypothetical protein
LCLQLNVSAQVAYKVKNKIPAKAVFFPLKDVTLFPAPLKHAMDKDAEYLLSLEPDRFLHWFRLNAGLQPKAVIYGG